MGDSFFSVEYSTGFQYLTLGSQSQILRSFSFTYVKRKLTTVFAIFQFIVTARDTIKWVEHIYTYLKPKISTNQIPELSPNRPYIHCSIIPLQE